MNVWDFVILGIVGIALGVSVVVLVRDKGKSCSCGCENCTRECARRKGAQGKSKADDR